MHTRNKRVTLKDVAQMAGVATGTVSMVLNDSPLIAETTRARVRQTMRDLGYVYDRAAGHLRSKRSKIVGVSMCELVNPYFVDVLAGIQEALDALGRVPVLGNCAESVPRQLRFLETLREYNVEGLLMTPVIGTPKSHVSQLFDWGMPVVQVTRSVTGVDTDYVGSDNKLGMEMAVRHLLELGHERIAYVGYNKLTTTGRDRFSAYRSMMKKAGIAIRDAWVIECPVTREGGFHSIAPLFGDGETPTALVCFNDLIAFGAMLGLRSIGIEPGCEVSVVGIDDVAEAALWQPPLTSIAVDPDLIGKEAGRLLTERIRNPERPTEHILLKPRLIVRASCGAPPSPSALSSALKARAKARIKA